jgi:hypothetical protein
MLLNLLDHHEDLLRAVLGRFVAAYDVRSLAALSAVNWCLYAAVGALPWWQHYCKLRHCNASIKSINILRNKFITMRDFNNNLVTYSYYPLDRINLYNTMPNAYYIHHNINKSYRITHDAWKYNIEDLKSQFISIKIYGKVPAWIRKYNYYVHFNEISLDGYVFHGESY